MRKFRKVFASLTALALMLATAISVSAADYGGSTEPEPVLPPPVGSVSASGGGGGGSEGTSAGSISRNSIKPEFTFNSSGEAIEVSGASFPGNSIVVDLGVHGNFGFAYSFTVSAGNLKRAGLDVSKVKLYHVAEDGTVTLIEDGIRITANGSIVVTIDHASNYVLSDVPPTGVVNVESGSKTVVGGGTVGNADEASSNNTWVLIIIAAAALASISGAAVIMAKRRKD